MVVCQCDSDTLIKILQGVWRFGCFLGGHLGTPNTSQEREVGCEDLQPGAKPPGPGDHSQTPKGRVGGCGTGKR